MSKCIRIDGHQYRISDYIHENLGRSASRRGISLEQLVSEAVAEFFKEDEKKQSEGNNKDLRKKSKSKGISLRKLVDEVMKPVCLFPFSEETRFVIPLSVPEKLFRDLQLLEKASEVQLNDLITDFIENGLDADQSIKEILETHKLEGKRIVKTHRPDGSKISSEILKKIEKERKAFEKLKFNPDRIN